MYQAVADGKLSGNGAYTKKCQQFFEQRYGFKKCLLTTSGTDALEMAAILCDIQPGDEVILIGQAGNEVITANDLGRWSDTISYEVLLAATERVHRKWINDDDEQA